jgi:putative membrane-bound dehydrogenase-like protein
MKKQSVLMSMVLAIAGIGVQFSAESKELTGVYTPAPTMPLPPDEAVKSFTLPEGYEMRLFASEPDVINPVAMTWDHKGRLWVLELFEYPMGAAEGEKPRDKVKVLEDTDGDGRADKVTVFADGLNLATGLALGNGGVYVGQAPHLLFFQDFDGDDVADTREVVLTGFGLEDRHELLNGFQWGPDGWLYMTHGVFTHSKVVKPGAPNEDQVIMNAALARFHPGSREFEVFADGTSNPWGVDFDMHGNAFVSACVIDHLFHMAPGGLYARQAGSPEFPYAYELLPSIVDHRHFRAAYAGVQVYQGHTYPEAMKGKIFMGNIHHNSVHQDTLVPQGASFLAQAEREFVKSSDGWFRPVATRTGPDGNLWIMDWYDKYPCYQNAMANPDGVDREYGRIWRVVHTGDQPGEAAAQRSRNDATIPAGVYLDIDSSFVVDYLSHPNNWVRRKARQVLTERREVGLKSKLENMVREAPELETRLEALWTLHGIGVLTDDFLDEAASDSHHESIRVWAARLTGERSVANEASASRLISLARSGNPRIASAVATALRQYVSGALTVNTPPSASPELEWIGPVFESLMLGARDSGDRTFRFQLWMAAEPVVMASTGESLNWYLAHGEDSLPLSGDILRRIMRRICDSRDVSRLDMAVEFLRDFGNDDSMLLAKALEGLIEGQRSRTLVPTIDTSSVIRRLMASSNIEVRNRASELGTLWGDATALSSLLDKIRDGSSSDDDRLKAIEVARQLRDDSAREALLTLANADSSPAVLLQTIEALGEVGGNEVAPHFIGEWKALPAAAKSAVARMMTTRWEWTVDLVNAIRSGGIAASDMPPTVVRSLVNHRNQWLRDRAREAIGAVQDVSVDRMEVFKAKKEVVLQGTPDLENGRKLAESTCLVCHTFLGRGQAVGPDLTGVGRSSLDALLSNVIMPNQIIGEGYELVIIETRDFRTISGRIVEETPNGITLMNAGGVRSVIERDNIESMDNTGQSVMPVGLEQMENDDFRDLIWYILCPPEEGPLTDEKRERFIGLKQRHNHQDEPEGDGESVALWDPVWRVVAPDFEGTPRKLPEFRGRNNVLTLHPWNSEKPAAIQRVVTLPQGRRSVLHLDVAAHEKGDWHLKVYANDRVIHEQSVDAETADWHHVEVDLTEYAGQKVTLFCANHANDWYYEFSYWGSARVISSDLVGGARNPSKSEAVDTASVKGP